MRNNNKRCYNNQNNQDNQGYHQYYPQNNQKYPNNQYYNQQYNNYHGGFTQYDQQNNKKQYYNNTNNYNNYNNNYQNYYNYPNEYYQQDMNYYHNNNYYQMNYNHNFNQDNNYSNNKKYNNYNSKNNYFGDNQSFRSKDNSQNSEAQSFSNNNEGSMQVGRFGGAKKQKKRNKITNEESFSQNLPLPPKKKQASLKEEISNQMYFPQKTQIAQYFTCPFNSQHIMEQKRALTHIQRCKKTSQNARFFEKCPYDPCHYFPTNQIQAHKIACPKRYKYEEIEGWDIPEMSNPEPQVNRSDDFTIVASMNNSTIASQKGKSQYEIRKREYQQFLIGQQQSFII